MEFINLTNTITWILIAILIMIVISHLSFTFYKSFKYFNLENKLDIIKNFKSIPTPISFLVYSVFSCVIVVLFSLLLLRPTNGLDSSNTTTTNMDIMFVIDTSLSMNVEDYKDSSRLIQAKDFAINLVNSRPNDRYGLVSFSDKAFIEVPLTFDKNTTITGIDTLTTVQQYNASGSSVGAGLKEAIIRLTSEDDVIGKERLKVIILITDGEENQSEIQLNNVTQEIKSNDILNLVIGVGSLDGDKIPYKNTVSNKTEFVKLDGKTIVSKLDEDSLIRIASLSDGQYFSANDSKSFIDASNEIDIKQKEIPLDKTEYVYKELYFYIAPIIILLLLILHFKPYDIVLKKIKNSKPRLYSINPFVVLLFPFLICIFSFSVLIGNAFFVNKKYSEAIDFYDYAIDSQVGNQESARHNKASALYKQKKYEESKKLYLEIIQNVISKKNNNATAQVYYNLGNSAFRIGEQYYAAKDYQSTLDEWVQAIEFYESCLEYKKDDTKCKDNLDFVNDKFKNLLDEIQQNGQNGNEGEEGEEPSEGNEIEKEIDRIKDGEFESREKFGNSKDQIIPNDGEYPDPSKPYW